MRVVVSGYVGKKITGIGRNLICLLNGLESRNEYIIYVNKDMEKEFRFFGSNITVKTYNISKNSSLKNLFWTTFIFPIKVLVENADKALIPNFTLLLFKFRPTIVIMHDLIEFNVSNKFSKKKMFYRTKLADPITARRADKIITVSENSKRDIVKFLHIPEEKISVIYNGVDQKKFQHMDETEAFRILDKKGWPHNFLLYAGTIDHPGKNAMALIKVFEQLKEENLFLGKLVLAGMPGAGYEVVESYVNQSKCRDNIVFTGYVTDEELIALYSTCRLFCFLSLYEGFGIPPLEALACGAKVLVSNTSSLPEVVADIGSTVDPTDIDAIRKAVLSSLQLDCYLETDKRVKEHLANYDWKNLSEKFEYVIAGEENEESCN